MCDEASRIFLARGLSEVDRDVQEHEEAEMTSERISRNDLVAGILAGRYENSLLIAGVLAADRAVGNGFAGLRPGDAPWPARPQPPRGGS
jgi:ADP-ribose pyrophosphatase